MLRYFNMSCYCFGQFSLLQNAKNIRSLAHLKDCQYHKLCIQKKKNRAQTKKNKRQNYLLTLKGEEIMNKLNVSEIWASVIFKRIRKQDTEENYESIIQSYYINIIRQRIEFMKEKPRYVPDLENPGKLIHTEDIPCYHMIDDCITTDIVWSNQIEEIQEKVDFYIKQL